MTDVTMTTDRVLELIHAYGAEPGGWPDEDREAARALLEAHPARFTEALKAARELDAEMMALEVPEPPAGLSDMILATAPKMAPEQNNIFGSFARFLFPQGAKWPASAALASLLMGLVGGYAYASTGVGYDQADSAYYTAFGFDGDDVWLEAE